eukprot:CAMPEP_0117039228 /NCGR_PEP_ID=MMETSP0472-20121206/27553_1 /TAXON_ID=693140 ORGANISM="Tiarina fusus, Strain LIS" /NCGR_SAMPLE_ID=MMETSP0472 /ASSEMBLY_ACC=CAM_ASM_000603 /LENGTH=218 /DNA_ID=CAMNT_0004749677 /DNA_START=192 /DNA_END=845 /DNA_ORIENTATION=+
MEHGKPKDIPIKEGEIFILPSYVPHSPQRPPGTIGLVIERERLANEMDGLRFYTNESNEEVLFEEWFHCTDLGIQLKPVIEKFFGSEAYKTGKPTKDSVQQAPFSVDSEITMDAPQLLSTLLESSDIANGRVALFDKGEFKVHAVGCCNTEKTSRGIETWLWQQKGNANVKLSDREITLGDGDVFVIPPNTEFSIERGENSVGLEVVMDPSENPNKKN